MRSERKITRHGDIRNQKVVRVNEANGYVETA